jgi:hypothetical protein
MYFSKRGKAEGRKGGKELLPAVKTAIIVHKAIEIFLIRSTRTQGNLRSTLDEAGPLPSSVLPFRRSAVPPFRRSALPPFRPSALLPFRPSALPPFCRSAVPPFRRSAVPPFLRSALPPFCPCSLPPFLLLPHLYPLKSTDHGRT